jgi:beta-glucuronidase
VPARWAGQRIVLRFGSATHRAVVWVSGRQVAGHEGGYESRRIVFSRLLSR